MGCKKHWLACLWLCVGLFLSSVSFADDFSILQANTHLLEHMYTLDAEIQYNLSDESIKALHNGMTLTLVLAVKVYKRRWYLWDGEIAKIQQRYTIRYNLLTQQYHLMHLNTDIEKHFDSLPLLLINLGLIKNLPLLDQKFIHQAEKYWVELHTKLDIESLPPSLRPLAYLSSDWRLNSGYYVCQLEK